MSQTGVDRPRALVAWYAAFVGGTALFPWLAVVWMDRGWSGSTATLRSQSCRSDG